MESEQKRRSVKPMRFSPTPQTSNQKRKNKRSPSDADTSGDILSTGHVFVCDSCGTNVYNSRLRGIKNTQPRVVQPYVRKSESGELMSICLNCKLHYDRMSKQSAARQPARAAIPDQQREEFAEQLIQITNNPMAGRLVCRNPNMTCSCSKKWIGSSSDMHSKIRDLLEILEAAAQLRGRKSVDKSLNDGKVGLGNGKKRSKDYEQYVLVHRDKMRNDMNLCEPLTQSILGYSNNFLHKRLLTEQKRSRVKGQKSSLVEVTSLWTRKCCRDNCTKLARSHVNLVARWRQLSQESQRGLQQAVAELLTPTAGARTNCYKFISMVTGCSTATIAKTSKQLKQNGGVLGLQEHGLRQYWRDKRQQDGNTDGTAAGYEEEMATVCSIPQHHTDEMALKQTVERQTRKLAQLEDQLALQQTELEKQNELLSRLVSNSKSQPTTPTRSRSIMEDNLQYPVAAKVSGRQSQMLSQPYSLPVSSNSAVIATSKPSAPPLREHVPEDMVLQLNHITATIGSCNHTQIHPARMPHYHSGDMSSQLPDIRTSVSAPNINIGLLSGAFGQLDGTFHMPHHHSQWGGATQRQWKPDHSHQF